jgi:ATP-dependent RNA helicase DDX5/DBP2
MGSKDEKKDEKKAKKDKIEKTIKKDKPSDAAATTAEPADGAAKAAKKEKKEKKEKKKEKRAREEGGADEAPKRAKAEPVPVFGIAGSSSAGGAAGQRRSPRVGATPAAAAAVPKLALDAKAALSGPLTPDEWRRKHAIRAEHALPDPIQTFAEAPFDAKILHVFQQLGFTEPSPVQAQAWPIALSGRDIIAVAKTGSGKTLGFLLPIFSAVRQLPPIDAKTGPLAIVLAPTRELAVQIHVEAERFGTPAGVVVACCYGGTPKGPQIGVLSRGRPAVVVATPGRINDLLSLDKPPVTDLKSCRFLVLDEADRMLDMGARSSILI